MANTKQENIFSVIPLLFLGENKNNVINQLAKSIRCDAYNKMGIRDIGEVRVYKKVRKVL